MIKPLQPIELEQLGAPKRMPRTVPRSEPEGVPEKVPSDESAPVFAQPWEAAAFAMVLSLYRTGHFEWREWVDLLAHEIAIAPADPTGELYYERWARALEKLVAKLNLLAPEAIGQRSEIWRQAYLATPHGQEVKLSNAHASGAN
jgi:nitrile hydratase accessory protein